MAEQAAVFPSQTYGPQDENCLSQEELKFLQEDRQLFDYSKIKIGKCVPEESERNFTAMLSVCRHLCGLTRESEK